jgi:hypothetical protein
VKTSRNGGDGPLQATSAGFPVCVRTPHPHKLFDERQCAQDLPDLSSVGSGPEPDGHQLARILVIVIALLNAVPHDTGGGELITNLAQVLLVLGLESHGDASRFWTRICTLAGSVKDVGALHADWQVCSGYAVVCPTAWSGTDSYALWRSSLGRGLRGRAPCHRGGQGVFVSIESAEAFSVNG